MDFLNFALTTATPATGTDATAIDPGMNSILMIVMVVVLGAGMWFFTIRPQRKRDKELKAQLAKMTVGDSIVTIGGVVGTIANIQEDEVTITTSVAHTMITFKKSAINTIIPR